MRALVALAAILPCLLGAAAPDNAPDLAGAWEGAVALPGGELGFRVVFAREGDALRATIDIPAQGAAGLALQEVRYAPPAVHFELPAGPGLAVFDGRLEGEAIAGSFTQAGFQSTFWLKREVAKPAPAPSPASTPADLDALAGAWEGAVALPGGELGFRVVFAREGDALRATIDIPAQGAAGLALQEVRYAPPAVHFELPAGPGLAVFDGRLEGEVIAGSFTQAGFQSTFSLKREVPKPAAPPPPYREEGVTVPSEGATLSCTFAVPPASGKVPALGFLSGSGPQTRDEDVFGFKVFAVLSDALVRQGIAVLRCDDRGVGASTGGSAEDTTETLSRDARALVRWLSARAEVDPDRAGLLGHSEGTIAAGLAALAAADRPDLLVLLAAPGVPGEALMVAQGERLMRAAGIPADAIAANAALQRKMFAAARSGEGWEALRAEVRAAMAPQFAAAPAERREALAAQAADAQIAMARSPWMRWFLDHDPAADLARVEVPVFVALGGKDLQVPLDQNRPPLEKALAGKRGVVAVFREANHLFQAAGTGGVEEYGTLPKAFVPGLTDRIAAFVLDGALAK